MQSRRFVLIGTRVEGTEVEALVQAAVAAGLDVRAAAQRPPPDTGRRRTGSTQGARWHRITDHSGQPGLGGVLASWVARTMRGPDVSLAEQLSSEPWLMEQVADPGVGEILLVALDDTAAQALARWRSQTGAVAADGRPVPVLTWDQGAEAVAEEIAQARASAEGVDAGTPGSPGDPPTSTPPAAPQPLARPDRPLGAEHALTVIAGGDGRPRQEIGTALTSSRVGVTLVDLDQVPHPDLRGADAMVLDGLGPAVLLLDAWPGLRVVHLQRASDRRSPWRHLLPDGRVDHVIATDVVDALTRGDAAAVDEVLAAALDGTTARLMRTSQDSGDEAALALAAQLLENLEEHHTPALLRELTFQAGVTGSLSLEGAVLTRQLGLPHQPVAAVTEALDRVTERLRETEPGWLPALPSTPVEPARSASEALPGRVLHLLRVTLPQLEAGYSVRGHQSLKALVEAGFDVVAVATPEADPSIDEVAGGAAVTETVLDGVRYLVPGPVPGGANTAYLEQQAGAVLDVVRRERPALLHVHSGDRGDDLGVVGAAVSAATGLPWVSEVRGLFESSGSAPGPRAERGETFARRMAKEAELVRGADAAVTLAETMRADLVARGVDAGHVSLVPNAVDPHQLVPAPRDEALARRWGTSGAFTVGCVTSLDHQRDQIEDLIRAAVILRDLGMGVRALIVGEGTRRARLEETARGLGAQDVVVFTGRVPHAEVAAAYALMDVLVVPRSAERTARLVTPLAPYEAMAMGLPVVVSAQPALLEVTGDGERGWSYPAGDAPALARLLQQLAADPARRAAVAARARDWVLAERTWSGNAQQYAALYHSVLPGRAAANG